MHKLKELLTRKVGPLPGIVWVLVLVGGILVARYLRAKNASPQVATDPTDGVDATTDPGALVSGTDSGTTGILDDRLAGLESDVGLLYDLYGSGDGSYAADTGFSAGDTGAASAAPAVTKAAAPKDKTVTDAPTDQTLVTRPDGSLGLGFTVGPNGLQAVAADPITAAAISNPNLPSPTVYATVSPSTDQVIYQESAPKPLPGNATAV